MLQIDGYYGAVGTVEVSVMTAAADAWTVSAGVQDLSCSLLTSFDPNGSISVNSNVGDEAVAWMWEGPFGFTSDASSTLACSDHIGLFSRFSLQTTLRTSGNIFHA